VSRHASLETRNLRSISLAMPIPVFITNLMQTIAKAWRRPEPNAWQWSVFSRHCLCPALSHVRVFNRFNPSCPGGSS
jgi:hypothetical protein